MPADMKNLVCWPEGSKECRVEKLKACDHSPEHAALGAMICRRRMTRTSAVTSRRWSSVRTASAVRLRQRSVAEDNSVEIKRSVGDADGASDQFL